MNKKISQRGQSLIELIIAIGIFVVAVSGLSFFVLNSYVSGRLSYDSEKADFLAQEGLEAVSSIRDNKWDDLVAGSHALALLNNQWIFDKTVTEENITSQLINGTRTIEIQDISQDRKKVISRVNWQFSPGRQEDESLVMYFTNWQKLSAEIKRPLSYTDTRPIRTINPALAIDTNGSTFATTPYGFSRNPSILFSIWDFPSAPYKSITLNYRYHADAAVNDTYAVALSLTGCKGAFFNLISPTSKGISDTTVSASIPPKQDFSKLCVKIYTVKKGGNDNANLYTHDIWTEGTF